MVKKITVISSNYPHPLIPERGTFVQSLVREWKSIGIKTNIIAPIRLFLLLRSFNRKFVPVEIDSVEITRPFYMSFSNIKIGKVNLANVNRDQFLKVAIKCAKRFEPPDLYYGKFLMEGGNAAVSIGKLLNRPSFADLGESKLMEMLTENELSNAKRIVSNLSGIICVSKRLVNEAIQLGADPNRVLLAPNSIDRNRYKPIEKQYSRKILGLSRKDFIVCFVGSFTERKGPLRVLHAIETLGPHIKGIFLGKGKQIPKGEKVLYAGPVSNDKIPLWLNASDVFVLPTLAEGHCNAINEAIACGIPVISSDIPDVRWQISQTTGILINPRSIVQIADAIKKLCENPQMISVLKDGCLNYVSINYQRKRGEIIFDWLCEMVGNRKC